MCICIYYLFLVFFISFIFLLLFIFFFFLSLHSHCYCRGRCRGSQRLFHWPKRKLELELLGLTSRLSLTLPRSRSTSNTYIDNCVKFLSSFCKQIATIAVVQYTGIALGICFFVERIQHFQTVVTTEYTSHPWPSYYLVIILLGQVSTCGSVP